MDLPDHSSAEADDSELLSEMPIRVPGYRFTGILGRGGQGTVYKAINVSDGSTVAIKILHGGPFADADARRRFEREIDAIKSLRHPNIVTHLVSGQTPAGHDFLIMNFIEGQRFDEYLWPGKRPSTLDLLSRLRLFIKICRAVGEAHRAGVIHRDLSPANIRVDASGEPHILDFGLVRHAIGGAFPGDESVVTATNQFVGRLAYASPEQVQGLQIDIRSDVYSLGVMLYQVLAGGVLPYDAQGSMVEALGNIVNTIPTRPSDFHREKAHAILQEKAWQVAQRALAKKSGERHDSGNELADELEHCLEGTFLPQRKFRQRTWTRIAVGLAAMVALMIGLLLNHSPGTTQNTAVMLPTVPKTFINAMGMKFVRIEGGEFTMGVASPTTSTEQMQPHVVKISEPFLLQTTPVTRGQFEAFVKATGYLTDAERRGSLGSTVDEGPSHDPKLTWENPGIVQDSSHPVVCVSWNDAMQFAAWLGKQDGQQYRLPTEAEWELACRAGYEGYVYSWGDNLETGRKYANVNWGLSHQIKTTPVGTLLPNNFGLYDMVGNAWEWCSDVMRIEAINAFGPTGPDVKNAIAMHVLRGAGYASNTLYCRMDMRFGMPANEANYASGFRLAMSRHTGASSPDLTPANHASIPTTLDAHNDDPDVGDWIRLIEGDDLKGLEQFRLPKSDDFSIWEVRNGVMTGRGGPLNSEGDGGVGEMRTTNLFHNFNLHFSTMLPEGPKGGGVRFVTPAHAAGQTADVGQFRITLGGRDPSRNPGSIWSNGRLMVQAKPVQLTAAQWYSVDVTHQNQYVNVLINNAPVCSFSDISIAGAPGHLAFMVDGASTIRFKDIRVRALN